MEAAKRTYSICIKSGDSVFLRSRKQSGKMESLIKTLEIIFEKERKEKEKD